MLELLVGSQTADGLMRGSEWMLGAHQFDDVSRAALQGELHTPQDQLRPAPRARLGEHLLHGPVAWGGHAG